MDSPHHPARLAHVTVHRDQARGGRTKTWSCVFTQQDISGTMSLWAQAGIGFSAEAKIILGNGAQQGLRGGQEST
jgi:hypothetical protein